MVDDEGDEPVIIDDADKNKVENMVVNENAYQKPLVVAKRLRLKNTRVRLHQYLIQFHDLFRLSPKIENHKEDKNIRSSF